MLCLHVLSFSVDASEVAELHVISYEVERDLTPLILSNCQYKVEHGGKSLQECDLEKIQRQLTSRFLQGKPRITLKGLPTLVYRRDWNYEHLLKDIRDKTPQVSQSGARRLARHLPPRARPLVRLSRTRAQATCWSAPVSVASASALSPLLLPEGKRDASQHKFSYWVSAD